MANDRDIKDDAFIRKAQKILQSYNKESTTQTTLERELLRKYEQTSDRKYDQLYSNLISNAVDMRRSQAYSNYQSSIGSFFKGIDDKNFTNIKSREINDILSKGSLDIYSQKKLSSINANIQDYRRIGGITDALHNENRAFGTVGNSSDLSRTLNELKSKLLETGEEYKKAASINSESVSNLKSEFDKLTRSVKDTEKELKISRTAEKENAQQKNIDLKDKIQGYYSNIGITKIAAAVVGAGISTYKDIAISVPMEKTNIENRYGALQQKINDERRSALMGGDMSALFRISGNKRLGGADIYNEALKDSKDFAMKEELATDAKILTNTVTSLAEIGFGFNAIGALTGSGTLRSSARTGAYSVTASGGAGLLGVVSDVNRASEGIPQENVALARINQMTERGELIIAERAKQAQSIYGYQNIVGIAGRQAGGNRSLIESALFSTENINKAAKIGLSADKMAELTAGGLSTQGNAYSIDQIFLAREAERRGYGSKEENMQRMGLLTAVGGTKADKSYETLLTKAIASGFDSSKGVSMIVESTAKMASEGVSSSLGIDLTGAVSSIISRALSATDIGKTEQQRMRQVGTASDVVNDILGNKRVDYSSKTKVAGLMSVTKGDALLSNVISDFKEPELVLLEQYLSNNASDEDRYKVEELFQGIPGAWRGGKLKSDMLKNVTKVLRGNIAMGGGVGGILNSTLGGANSVIELERKLQQEQGINPEEMRQAAIRGVQDTTNTKGFEAKDFKSFAKLYKISEKTAFEYIKNWQGISQTAAAKGLTPNQFIEKISPSGLVPTPNNGLPGQVNSITENLDAQKAKALATDLTQGAKNIGGDAGNLAQALININKLLETQQKAFTNQAKNVDAVTDAMKNLNFNLFNTGANTLNVAAGKLDSAASKMGGTAPTSTSNIVESPNSQNNQLKKIGSNGFGSKF